MDRRAYLSAVDRRNASYCKNKSNRTARGRTRAFVSCIALAAAVAFSAPANATRPRMVQATSTMTSVPATPAGNFYQAIGINTHAWYSNPAWSQRLVELGVANIRTMIAQNKTYMSQLSPFLANGGKIDALIVKSSGGTLDKTVATKNLAFLKAYVGLQRVSGIEGPNEFNNGEPTNWAATERNFVQWLHDTVR